MGVSIVSPTKKKGILALPKKIQVDSYTKKVKNEEKTTPLYHQIRFIDSFKFMRESLEKLVNNLSKDASPDSFSNVQRYYTEDKLHLLTRKGIYPHEYMDTLENLKETQLQPKEAFYSRLNDEGISDKNYEHPRKVWKTFKMKNLEDYHNLYNRVDVLLLADVFENFRDICIKNYNLDPAHYYTAPGLAWDAALKVSKVELELLSDMDMLLVVEKGIRGGDSMISNRYGKPNNEYMGKSFKDKEPSKYITYLDANNLYGWAISKPLPTHNFKWMKPNELQNWENYSCILEVDLEYSRSLHDLHSDYPLAPEQIKRKKVDKLIPNLWNKKEYVIHYKTSNSTKVWE